MKTALGKGLEALIPKSGPETAELDIERIVASAEQPRRHFDDETLRELAQSIKEKGILQPLIVCPLGDGSFKLIAGERRLRAARMAGLKKVPAVLKKSAPQECMEIALIENIQREDLNPIETAKALERLQSEFNLSQEALSERLGKERATLANYLRLLKLPAEVQGYIAAGKLQMGHAKVILSFDSQAQQLEAARQAVRERLSVRQMEGLLRKRLLGGRHRENLRKALLKAKDPDVAALEERLIKSLGTKVRLRHRGKKGGRVEIEYYSLDELQRILERLL